MRLEMTKVCMHSFNSKHANKYATIAMGHQCAFHLFNAFYKTTALVLISVFLNILFNTTHST